ncbi:MAG: precorrin-6A reductase [Blautia sp.]|nr:precorrin-6A reductase [Blautia sp.]
MNSAIIFAGTTEGYEVCRFLQENRIPSLACVATEYGKRSLQENEYLRVSAGRLDADQMKELFLREKPAVVVDATHPYAAVVTGNIRTACEQAGLPYLRVLRPKDETVPSAVYVPDVDAAAEYLSGTEGNILLTTGSKELKSFTRIPDYKERLYARVLSLPNVMDECRSLGFEGKHLIGMQGPFSREMNEATLRQYQCKYLVTKDTGTAGGMEEKTDAAMACGAVCVIIGRPMQEEEGVSVPESRRKLAEIFGLKLPEPQVTLLGIGMDGKNTLTQEAKDALSSAELIIGARRMVDSVIRNGQSAFYEYDSERIAAYIREHPEYRSIVVALSGDVGFYSGAKKLLDLLGGTPRMICGISSVNYFFARIRLSWDDACIVSAHGRSCNLVSLIRTHKKVFAILGTRDGVSRLASSLTGFGMGDVMLYVGENLSYENEKCFAERASQLCDYQGDPLCVVVAVNEAAIPKTATHGLPDEAFLRGKAPMTKEEVRCVSLAKLRLQEDSVCYDVGAGTGSVSIEMALRASEGKVYAIEKKEDALSLLQENRLRFAADNLEIVPGTAPEAMEALPAPTHAFIGGSSGNMKAILSLLLQKNPRVRVVVNCITLETVTETLSALKELPVADTDIVQLSAARAKTIAGYHMMMGENPIYIITFAGNSEGNIAGNSEGNSESNSESNSEGNIEGYSGGKPGACPTASVPEGRSV